MTCITNITERGHGDNYEEHHFHMVDTINEYMKCYNTLGKSGFNCVSAKFSDGTRNWNMERRKCDKGLCCGQATKLGKIETYEVCQ